MTDGYRKTKALTLRIDCTPRQVSMVTSGIASYTHAGISSHRYFDHGQSINS